MPIQSVKISAGVNRETTPALGQAQIVRAEKVRFKYAGNLILPEKLGGWQKFYQLSLGSPIRDLHAWEGINSDTHLAAGCESSLNVISSGVGIDITPRTERTDEVPAFSTTNGDNLVTIVDNAFTASIYDSIYILTPVSIGGIVLQGAYQVNSVLSATSYTILAAQDATATAGPGGDVPIFTTTNGEAAVNVELPDHGYLVGTIFPIPTPTTVGGITLSGAYLIQDVVDADNFTINASQTATSGASADMNGGDAAIVYYVGLGPDPPTGGYGSGGYGSGGYGLGVVPTADTGTPITATNWMLDNWGEVLLACPANGPIYQWSPDSGIVNATKIVNAPLVNGGIFVSQPAQILVAWASSTNSVQDPLQVNWSDSGNYNNWTVSSQTQAGGYRLPTGSRIVGGLAGPEFGILWTDVGVWSMDYIGPPLIFGFNSLGDGCGLIGRHAYAVLNSVVYWMSNGQFCSLVGETVQTIPCTVWDDVFPDLDTANADKIFCGANSPFNEVWWFYPSTSGGGDVDRYAKFNPILNLWDSGTLARSAWIDQSVLGTPIGASPSGFIYQHEMGYDDDGQPMLSWIETGYFVVADGGDQLMFVDWLFPDFKWLLQADQSPGIISITLKFRDYPNGVENSVGPYAMSDETTYVNTRLRARYVALTIESFDLGAFWRLGDVKIRSVPDGRL